ncbi:hypothetical protein MHM84_00260 [Halomonas sp. McH1-25]|uniref:hypothetical protein n=1 Tax=unclassified Halomonas TaxID=2609666 RepID=UPI001EF5CB56|nr:MULTISPECIES: hypothetical protein [unclassified Halomonas]MCG7598213.1 hypothetical protein [Halomonas sp. McH1-25]MCP1341004.1 hypothetical protein [Halomonas sp. FL8]MCP1363215.1 hypothetical protein [Halomonas sp. BBD45]
MANIGVLTGDVVGSQRIDDKQALSHALDDSLRLLQTTLGARSDRYRGDGFQVAVPNPGQAMLAAILLRASLIRHSPSRSAMWDARIAVAVGGGRLPTSDRFSDAQEEAFVLSGRRLDALGDGPDRLAIVTPAETAEGHLALLTRFADDIVSHWSSFSAEVVSLSLLHRESQQQLAKRLGRAQPTVNRRLAAARWPLIRDYLDYMQKALGSVAT